MKTVTTQVELDASDKNEWVKVDDTWSDVDYAVAMGSAHVVACGSAHVVAWGSAHVVAWGSAHVVAWGSAHVEAWGSAHVVAWGSAHVEARGSAHVEAWGSAHVVALEFSTVSQHGNNVVVAAHGKAHALKVEYPAFVEEWADLKGLRISDGQIVLWKAVRENGTDFRSGTLVYGVGITTTAPDWNPDYRPECGCGLHLADSPSGARLFVPPLYAATFRLFRVTAKIEDCRCYAGNPQYPQKLRARACVGVEEVARDYVEPM